MRPKPSTSKSVADIAGASGERPSSRVQHVLDSKQCNEAEYRYHDGASPPGPAAPAESGFGQFRVAVRWRCLLAIPAKREAYGQEDDHHYDRFLTHASVSSPNGRLQAGDCLQQCSRITEADSSGNAGGHRWQDGRGRRTCRCTTKHARSNREKREGEKTGMSEALTAKTISITGHGSDEIEAYLAVPDDGAGPRGSVVVIHHMPGYDSPTKEIVRRFAANGYAALIPDPYYREAPAASPHDAAATARA